MWSAIDVVLSRTLHKTVIFILRVQLYVPYVIRIGIGPVGGHCNILALPRFPYGVRFFLASRCCREDSSKDYIIMGFCVKGNLAVVK